MQRAEESESRARGLTPLNAFLVGLGLLIAIAAAVLLSRPDEAPTPTPNPNPEPAFALTDPEAIERFIELDSLRLRAYDKRDVSLVSEIFTSDSPIARKVSREIGLLRSENVLSKTQFEVKKVGVLGNTDDEIRILQRVVIFPRFVTESGRDVTRNARDELQTIHWTLHLEGTQWLLHNATITRVRALDQM